MQRISSVAQRGDDGDSWRGWRIGGGAGNASHKRIPLRVQPVGCYGYAGKWFSGESDAAMGRAAAVVRGASRSEDVKCVPEDGVEVRNLDLSVDGERILF